MLSPNLDYLAQPTPTASINNTWTMPTTTTTTTTGLMGTAKARPGAQIFQPAQTGGTSTYTPTGYNPYGATASSYTPATGNATAYDPTKVDKTGINYNPTTQVVQNNQLVSDRLNGLTSGNSRYIQDARQQGREQAARSGLMTSSIAAGNAERSAIQAALPIAQADAARYGTVADQNMAATNTAAQFNSGANLNAATSDANASNAAGQFNANASNQMAATNMAAQNEAGQFNANAANTNSQFNANSANQAAAYSANAANEGGQFNAGQVNANAQFNAGQFNASALNQEQLAENQHQYDSSLVAQQTNNWLSWQNQREQSMGQILASIYQNPNLTPAQQQQAADNAKVIYQGLWNATNNTFASGVPQIFFPS